MTDVYRLLGFVVGWLIGMLLVSRFIVGEPLTWKNSKFNLVALVVISTIYSLLLWRDVI